MAKNIRQLKKQYIIVSVFDPIFQIMIIGLSGLVLHIGDKQGVPHLIRALLPTGMQWGATAGLLAIVMSAADSYLHAAGITFTHDIIRPLYNTKKHLQELQGAQYATLGIGGVSIVVGLFFKSMLSLIFSAMQFTEPVLIFPLVAGILGIKADKRAFL